MPGDKVRGKDPFEIKTAAKIEENKAEVKKRQPAVQSKPTIRKIAPMELIERTLRNHSYKGKYAEALEVFDSILAHEHLSPAEKSAVHFYMVPVRVLSRQVQKSDTVFSPQQRRSTTEGTGGVVDSPVSRKGELTRSCLIKI